MSRGRMKLLSRTNELVKMLTFEQLAYLDRVWSESLRLERSQWIECFDFHNWFDTKKKALEMLESIGGSFIQDADRGAGGRKAYSLTLLGILACPSNEKHVANIISILEHIRSIAGTSSYPIRISDENMCKIADVMESELDVIEQVFYRSYQISSLIHRVNGYWVIE